MRGGTLVLVAGVWSLLPTEVMGQHRESSCFLDRVPLEGGNESTLGEQGPGEAPCTVGRAQGFAILWTAPEPQLHLSLHVDLCET